MFAFSEHLCYNTFEKHYFENQDAFFRVDKTVLNFYKIFSYTKSEGI